MSRVVELLCSRRMPHVAALALMSIGFAGCSADMTTRLSQKIPLQSLQSARQFGWQRTGSVPTPQVEHRELPQYSRPQCQYQSQALPPPISAPQSYPTASASTGVSGGGRGLASYRRRRPIRSSRPPAALRRVRSPRPAHPAQGGTTIIVGTSDTLETLSRRYNVSAAAILQANGYKGPRTLSPGQQLIIPHQAAAAVAAPALARAGQQAGAVASAPASVHFVNHGDTLLSIAHQQSRLGRGTRPRPTISISRPSSSSA